jgi:UDP-N-acetylglucosamine--dolichyl-phosphate N-acetylglucosaminephosphotransferase
MIDLGTLVASVGVSFVTSFLMIPVFIRFMHATGIIGYDIMKAKKIPVADMGGPGVITGFMAGMFTFIALEVFKPDVAFDLVSVLASLNTILIITLIGIFDSLTSRMKDREGHGIFERLKRRGIPGWVYFFIPLPAAAPLMAVNVGKSYLVFPFLGRIELGIIFPMIIVPLAVLFCSNATNFLAGFNGLEAGMGFVLHITLGIYALQFGRFEAATLAFVFAAALLSFLRYNWFPAKVFPGDLNHTIGAVVVCVALLGNMEKFASLCFLPWIIESFLKLSSRFKAESYGLLQRDGTVKSNGNIRSLTHLVMSLGSYREWQVSTILILVEVVVCVTSFWLINFIR